MSGWLMTESDAVPFTADRFAHILSAIDAVQEELHEISQDALANDRMRRLALERLLEIISIASGHIPANLKAVENGVDWQVIADIGDRLENARDRIETNLLWTISQDKLMPLKVCAERHLREPG
ncbi:DUF86 domain-containing protein [Bradyrhizobium sp.]|uniref:HepT-like ribonuclease domain-containing protein n=1 Tax=Bradyrhizobium sp. TaxID=376 RepID=UPI003C772B58